MSDEVVISLGVADIERAKQFFCEGLGFEIQRSAGPFAAFKESKGGPGRALHRSATRVRRRSRH
jgi:catechol 2,3-dioxygenase-like lactoylglutathione lyase family enzyme